MAKQIPPQARNLAARGPALVRCYGARQYLGDGSIWERDGRGGLALVYPPDGMGWDIRELIARRRQRQANALQELAAGGQ